LFRIKCSLF